MTDSLQQTDTPLSLVSGASVAVAEGIAEACASAGVEVFFGVPGGGANLELIGALEAAGIEFVLTHMETPAAIMATTYADLTGRPGACLATRGPGAASLANGVAQAYLDRSPILVVTDAISPAEGLRVSRQRIDQTALFTPITKWSTPIGAQHAVSTASVALRVATEGRPGPVHLDVVPDSTEPRAFISESYSTKAPTAALRRRAIELLQTSCNPVMIVGMAAIAARGFLRALVVQKGCRVLTTYRAKGIIPESFPHHAGLFTGGTLESEALSDADLLVLVGVDPVELIPSSWAYKAPIVSLMPWERDADYYSPDVELIEPLELSLQIVSKHLRTVDPGLASTSTRSRAQESVHIDVEGLAPHEVTTCARKLAPRGSIATIDSGAHMLVAMQDWSVDEFGETLISSGHATMAYALPAAIAAASVRKGERVVCLTGDGGLSMALGELETVVRKNLHITVVVFNDSALSLIEIKRSPTSHGPLSAVRYEETDFAEVASGFGITSERVETTHEFEAAFRRSLSLDGPTLIDVAVDPSGYRAVLEATRGKSAEH